MTDQNQSAIITIANEAGLAEDKSRKLLSSFSDLFNDARQTVKSATSIVVTDVTQIEEMSNARKTRLELKSIRVQVENTRKELKEQSIREGKAVDGIANVIKALIVPVEEYLESQEKFAERVEAERKNNIELERINKLSKYFEEPQNLNLHPDQMSEETFGKLLENSALAFEAKKKAEEEAEKERLAKIEADRKEQERIKAENIRLRLEAEKRDRELAVEREKVKKENELREAKLKKEREQSQKKLEAEQKARQQAEEIIRKEKEAQEAKQRADAEKQRQSLLAPDKEKLQTLAILIQSIEMPAVKSDKAMLVVTETKKSLQALAERIVNAKL